MEQPKRQLLSKVSFSIFDFETSTLQLRGNLPSDFRNTKFFDEWNTLQRKKGACIVESTYSHSVVFLDLSSFLAVLGLAQPKRSFVSLSVEFDTETMSKKMVLSSMGVSKEKLGQFLPDIEQAVQASHQKSFGGEVERVLAESYNLQTFQGILTISNALFNLNYSLGRNFCEFVANFNPSTGNLFRSSSNFCLQVLDIITKDYNPMTTQSKHSLAFAGDIIEELLSGETLGQIRRHCLNQTKSLRERRESQDHRDPEFRNIIENSKALWLLFIRSQSLLEKLSLLEELQFTCEVMTKTMVKKTDFLTPAYFVRQGLIATDNIPEAYTEFQILIEFVKGNQLQTDLDQFLLELDVMLGSFFALQ